MKDIVKIARSVALYGQLGFTLVTPPVVMALLCVWLQRRFLLGSWVVLLGILLGLTAAASGVFRFYRRVVNGDKQEENSTNAVFYRHE